MDWLFLLLLFLHVGGAIVAFGPTFAFPILGPMAGHEPQHVNFALRFQKAVATTLIVPLALLQGVTGLLLVWKIGLGLLAQPWLLLGIALYIVALVVSIGIGLPTVRKLIEFTSAPPPTPPPGSPPSSGPPPHIAALVKRGRQLGMVQTALIVAIVFLMVAGPRGFLNTPLF
jgi:uncharacterized membrane protein